MACHPHQVVIDNMLLLSAEAPEDQSTSRAIRLDPRIRFETTFIRQFPEFPDPGPVLDTRLEAW